MLLYILVMTREAMIGYLKKHSATAQQLATEFQRNIDAVVDDIDHIRTSLRDDPNFRLMIRPPKCEFCGYQFAASNIKTPTRCPECKKEKIAPTRFRIEKK